MKFKDFFSKKEQMSKPEDIKPKLTLGDVFKSYQRENFNTVQPIYYPIQPPEIQKGVVPDGVSPPVMAMDNCIYNMGFNNPWDLSCNFNGFPGFAYLSLLSTIAEYRQFADVNANELTREWISIISSDKKSSYKIKIIEQKMDDLKVRDAIRLSACYVELFGISQISFEIEGHDYQKPLVLSNRTIKRNSFKHIAVIEPIWSTPNYYNAVNPLSRDFYKPQSWFVMGQEVHHSRLLTIVTRPLPDILKPVFNFAGISLSQLAEPYVNNWIKVRQAVADLIYNFSILTLKTDLTALLQDGIDVSFNLQKRIKEFTEKRNNFGLMLLDKSAEELEQIAVPLGGLYELQIKAHEMLSTVSGIPAVKLLGTSPAGFNATADGEIRAFYDKKASEQEAYWRSPIKKIIDVIQISEFGEIDPSVDFVFNPLWQMDDKQRAEIQNLTAQADIAYIENGVFSNEEIRSKVIKDEENSYNIEEKGEDFTEEDPDENFQTEKVNQMPYTPGRIR